MGLNRQYIGFFDDVMAVAGIPAPGAQMLELGNQRIYSLRIRERTGKEYFQKRHFHHTSIDLNGLDGALIVDLAVPDARPRWREHFDIITNFGTTEHVEPLSDQYECFRNIHRWLKPGGVVVHLVPDIGELERRLAWAGHCNNYYSQAFFAFLAETNGYEVLTLGVIDGMVATGLRKTGQGDFMDDKQRFLEHIDRVEGGSTYMGARSPFLRRFSGWLYRVGLWKCKAQIYFGQVILKQNISKQIKG